jgi:long-chain fatty acid transport protein
VIYTQWSVFQNLQLQNVAGLNAALEQSRSISVNIPQYFRNTISASVGADYFITDKIILRGGFGIDQSPVNESYRNVQLPDNNRFAFAIGSHIQSTPTLGFDLGWTHLFMNESNINPPAQVMGAQVVSTVGTVNGGADVLAAQVVWDMV